VLAIDESTIIKKGRLQPGKMLLVDTEQGKIIADEEIKQQIASSSLMAAGWRIIKLY
jgi:glutamate synthase (NADPH/NADH) large chain